MSNLLPSGLRRRAKHERKLRAAMMGMAAAAALLLVPFAAPANAVYSPPDNAPAPVAGPNSDIEMTGTGPGENIRGFLAATPTIPDPLAPYPAENPVGVPTSDHFSGIITTADVNDPTAVGQMYCINIRVVTTDGVGYVNGTWEESNVPNIGYVNYILNNYYPANPALPAGLTTNQQAAAVQAAIWYFTDGYLVNTAQTDIRPAVEAIVADAQANGPLLEPPAPDVTITPASAAAPVGSPAGPYTVAAEGAAELSVSVPTGYTMYTDAAGTAPLANPSTVPSGTQIWVGGPPESTTPGVLSARASVTVQTGSVYLYDRSDPGREDAQRLILAVTTELNASAQATAEFFVAGNLLVNKTFAGGAVGSQGAITLTVDCGAAGAFVFDIPAGTATGVSETVTGLPVGTVCAVTEEVTGSTTEVTVTPVLPEPVTIAEGENVLEVTNNVEFNPGNLVVAKTIVGSGAGLQDAVVLHVQCGDGLIDETVTIPAGTTAGTFTQLYEGIPAGVMCRVSEPTSGVNEDVTVQSSGTAEVTILPGQVQTAEVVNEYAPVPVTERLPRTGAEDTAAMATAAGGAVLAGSLLIFGSMRKRRS